MQIRAYADSDWPEVAAIVTEVAAAAQTYAVDPVMDEAAARAFWLGSDGFAVVVAEADGRVLGTAKAGRNRDGPGRHVATASFMVGVQARGHGVGRALGAWAVEWCRQQGFRSIQFNAVVESNTAAVRLWQQLGFRIIGTVPEAFEHPHDGLVGLHVMWLPLVADRSVGGGP